MYRVLLLDCWPFLAAIVACFAVSWWLGRAWKDDGTRQGLQGLHSDERGAVQSLSFVLTLPIFVILMLFVVQLSQLTIARIMVEFAAYAAARSAIVWIPADLGDGMESPNRIGGSRQLVGSETDENGNVFLRYRISQQSRKFQKIELAAAQALMTICPSRDVGANPTHPGVASYNSLERAYLALDPNASGNTRIPTRLRNKLFYALAATTVQIEARHKESEPPLIWHDMPPHRDEFADNEIGWQDQLLITVHHDFALLPGPARLLAKRVLRPGESSDEVADRIQQQGSVFVYPLSATVRLSNEGEKPLRTFVQSFAE